MDKNGKTQNIILTAALSADGFTTAYIVMFVVLFLPYSVLKGQLIAAGLSSICFAVPFALMPVMYAFIHRFDPLLFGRYHLIMPLSAFASALFFVMFWCGAGGASGSAMMFFGAFFGVPSTVLYRYCSFSVRARLGGDGAANSHLPTLLFSALGAGIAVASVSCFFYANPDTFFSDAAYVVAAIGVVLAMFQYLTTYYGIPQLSLKRVQSIKSAFRNFYSGLNRKMYFSALFSLASYATLAALCVMTFYAVIPRRADLIVASACVLVAAYIIGSFICNKAIKSRSTALSVGIFVCFTVTAALAALTEVFAVSNAVSFTTVSSCALMGLGGSAAMRQTRLRFLTIKSKTTGGTAYLLIELTAFAAIAIAVASVSAIGGIYTAIYDFITFVYGFAVAAVFAIVSLAVAMRKSKKVGGARSPELPDTALSGDTVATEDRDDGDGDGGDGEGALDGGQSAD